MFHAACGILVPQPGIEPAPPALWAWSLNHWTTREVPVQGTFRCSGKQENKPGSGCTCRSVTVGTQNGQSPVFGWREVGASARLILILHSSCQQRACLSAPMVGRVGAARTSGPSGWAVGTSGLPRWLAAALCFSWGDGFALGQKMLLHEQLFVLEVDAVSGQWSYKGSKQSSWAWFFSEQPLLGVIALRKAWGLTQWPVFSRMKVELPLALPTDPPSLTRLGASSSITSWW